MSRDLFRQIVSEELSQGKPLLFENISQKMAMILDVEIEDLTHFKELFIQIVELKFIRSLLSSSARELIIHNHEVHQTVGSTSSQVPFPISPEDFQLALEILCTQENVEWNYSTPFASFFWKHDGNRYRVSLIHSSCSPKNGPKIFFRKIANNPFPLASFGVEQKLSSKLTELVMNKKNIIIAGSTGCGKSALLATLVQEIPPDQHLIVMEDTHEIATLNPLHTFLLANSNNDQKSLKAYCAYALRMSPDRLILGEIRSGEIVPFVLSMNTGHKGLMSTIHANSAHDAISRLAVLFCLFSEQKEISYQLILKLICSNVDYIVQMDQCCITEIIHILGSDEERPIFELVYSRDNPI